jgi:transposase
MTRCSPIPSAEVVVGIDVAKATLACVWLPRGEQRTFANEPAGWAALITWLAPTPPDLIVLEATGSYHVRLTEALAAADLLPAVINPTVIHRFAQSLSRHAKTDHSDALTLAWYGQRMRPEPQPLRSPARRQLQALVTRRAQVNKLVGMEQNRLAVTDPIAQSSVTTVIACLTAQLTSLATQIAAHIKADPELAADAALLTSVPGIGPLISATLIAAVPELGQRTGKQLAALVGLAPFARDSGTHRGLRFIAGGRADVRRALYLAVLTMRRFNPIIAAHLHHLEARGKPSKLAMIASARRLLGILNAMLRDRLTWSETQVGQGAFLPPPA